MSNVKIGIIGAGIFGCVTSLKLSEHDAEVHLFDINQDILHGASYNNHNRLHLGFHYPRDTETARQCIQGYNKFLYEFKDCVRNEFPNSYFISSVDSKITPDQYLNFCKDVGLEFNEIDISNFNPKVQSVSLGISTKETIYDCNILRSIIRKKLCNNNVHVNFNSNVESIQESNSKFYLVVNNKKEGPFDILINCTYANINFLNSQLGLATPTYQYEYTMIPIIEWHHKANGITIMDGEFMTVMPFGFSNQSLLYHVNHSVVSRFIGNQIPTNWLDARTVPSVFLDKTQLFEKIKFDCSKFVPDIINAKLLGYLQGPRMVLANKEETDGRPSIINQHLPNYFSIFGGKVDHSVWIADSIVDILKI